jgi:hypothetical protein
MTTQLPLVFRWDGEHLVPMHPRFADRQFTIGMKYIMVELQERSEVSHRHEFAFLREAWLQLGEEWAEAFPTPEHLRKRALIQAGYFDRRVINAGTQEAAADVAALVRGMDDFSLVEIDGIFVTITTAKSQSRRSMDKADFQASKTAILEIVSGLIGVTPEQLTKNSEQ